MPNTSLPSFFKAPLTPHRAWVAAATLSLCLASLSLAAAQPVGRERPSAEDVYLRTGPSLTEVPAAWVASGPGLLAYGAGRDLTVALDSEPRRPVSRLTLEWPASAAVFFGRYVYVLHEGIGIEALDLAVPAEPASLGLLSLPGLPERITQMGNHMVVLGPEGLRVLEVGATDAMGKADGTHFGSFDPLRTMEIGYLPLSGPFTAAAVSGTTVYAATGAGQLLVVGLSDPALPSLSAIHGTPEPITALTASGDLLFAATGEGHLLALLADSPDFEAPVLRIPGSASALLAQGRILYAASGEGGLRSYEAGRAAAQTVNVNVGNIFFQPSTVTVNQGDTVQWTWVGGSHSSTSGKCSSGTCVPDGLWNSGVKSAGTFSRVFNDEAGEDYHYFCIPHGAAQTGKVIIADTTPPGLTASASAAPLTGTAPLAVSFTGTASGGAPPYSYSWVFGDGGTSTDQNPTHTYVAEGTFTAALTASDSSGASASSAPVTVSVGSVTVPNPAVASMTKAGNPFRILVSGSHFQSGIEVTINGTRWSNVKVKSGASLIIKGGGSLKALVPKNTPTLFKFENPDGGQATVTFQWP